MYVHENFNRTLSGVEFVVEFGAKGVWSKRGVWSKKGVWSRDWVPCERKIRLAKIINSHT